MRGTDYFDVLSFNTVIFCALPHSFSFHCSFICSYTHLVVHSVVHSVVHWFVCRKGLNDVGGSFLQYRATLVSVFPAGEWWMFVAVIYLFEWTFSHTGAQRLLFFVFISFTDSHFFFPSRHAFSSCPNSMDGVIFFTTYVSDFFLLDWQSAHSIITVNNW